MDEQKNKRRNYFIKKEFQTKFILKFCGLVILGAVISGVSLYLFSRGTVTTTFVNSRLSIMSTADYILPALFGSSIVTIALIGLVTAVVVRYLSHRIAGPLYKIEKSVKEIGAGDLTLKIKLRSTDEIKKMADCVNEMAKELKNQALEIKTKSGDLDRQIDNLEIQDALKKLLKEKKKELDKALDCFKTA